MDAPPPEYRVVAHGKPGYCAHRMRRRVTATADGVVVRCECVRCGFATEAVYLHKYRLLKIALKAALEVD